MRKTAFLVLAVIALSAAPARAGKVYVPVVDRNGTSGSQHRTEVWVANNGAEERRYALTFLAAGSNGTQRGDSARSGVAGGKTSRLINLAAPGAFGMAELDAAPQLLIDARLVNTPASGPGSSTPVPVISSDNALAAATTAYLVGLARTPSGLVTDLDLVNLADTGMQCTVAFHRADGTQISSTAVVTLQPLSLRHFADALGLLGESQLADARAAVTCDKQFFAFATLFDGAAAHVSFVLPAASGASTLGGEGGTTPPPPPPGNAIVFTAPGLLHKPTRGNEIKQVSIPVTGALSLSRLVAEWEIVPGPWNPVNTAGAHLCGWFHRGKFRSNTVFNVNAFGPNRGEVKNNQNVDLPQGGVTNNIASLTLVQGTRYKIRAVYDAAGGTVTVTFSTGSLTVATIQHPASAANGTLTVPATGLVMHFGHSFAQQAIGQELPTYGWEYHNLRVEMYQR